MTFRELIIVLDDRSHEIDKQRNFYGSILISFDKRKDFKNTQIFLTLTMILICM